MQLVQTVARICAFVGLAPRQFETNSSVFEDPETGLTFASYTSDRGITFRVAIPDLVPETKIFDTVLQIVSPNDIGWAGWAWGGHMSTTRSPLPGPTGPTTGYFNPPEYPDATYTVLRTGTHINVTHWQVTAKCTGCSRWGDDDVGYTKLDPQDHTPPWPLPIPTPPWTPRATRRPPLVSTPGWGIRYTTWLPLRMLALLPRWAGFEGR
ncbi:iron reductase domain protein [Parathielavia hyrcaniae]|uniref:Iron reductase domain protein n=1 Tax=Parathielavia hyrcaniae TaxID=113614 RepID=A0AAN6SWV7_9PEZI|nr:iron reductase domain protein [Parathielavia hyrcaniae]